MTEFLILEGQGQTKNIAGVSTVEPTTENGMIIWSGGRVKGTYDSVSSSMASTTPNQERSTFKKVMDYLLDTYGADGRDLRTVDEVALINGAWPT